MMNENGKSVKRKAVVNIPIMRVNRVDVIELNTSLKFAKSQEKKTQNVVSTEMRRYESPQRRQHYSKK